MDNDTDAGEDDNDSHDDISWNRQYNTTDIITIGKSLPPTVHVLMFIASLKEISPEGPRML